MVKTGKTCVILDLDGTVYLGNTPIPGAIDFIRRYAPAVNFYYLSNNTSKGPAAYLKKLRGMGLAVRQEDLLSPTPPLVDHLRRHSIMRAFLVGNADYACALAEAMPELVLTEQAAQAVILAYDTELTYHKLAVSARLLHNPQVAFLATHPDLVCPDPGGPLPDVGSFIALYEKAVGRTPEYIFGKPDPKVLAPVLALYPKERMLMAGDRLSTDKKLAENAGIDFVLVLSGEATLADVQKEQRQPWRIVPDLGKLEI